MLRPLLACSLDTEDDIRVALDLHGSLMVSEKKDGIRASVSSGQLTSRAGKPITNPHLQKHFENLPEGLEGELVFTIDRWDIHPPLNQINSIVSSGDMWPRRWTPMFLCFDWTGPSRFPFRDRYRLLKNECNNLRRAGVWFIPQFEFNTLIEIVTEFQRVTKYGGEGICLRNPNARYKSGRSTIKGGELMRFKKLMADKAEIVGLTKLLTHVGPQDRNVFGLAKRDKKKENRKETEQLGSFQCIHPIFGEFSVGSGFTDDQRTRYGRLGETLIGSDCWFEYRDVTDLGKPRNPVFKELIA
jgi:DNA ligase-1